jgi:ABC-type microcin C transport system permease subunit YejB
MVSLLARRLLLSLPTLAGVLVVVFLLLYVAPGDPVQAMVGERADPATIARLRAELRLDDPLPAQFLHYAGGILTGDLGRSYVTNRPIVRDIAERFPRTLLLATAAMLLATLCGITIGVLLVVGGAVAYGINAAGGLAAVQAKLTGYGAFGSVGLSKPSFGGAYKSVSTGSATSSSFAATGSAPSTVGRAACVYRR